MGSHGTERGRGRGGEGRLKNSIVFIIVCQEKYFNLKNYSCTPQEMNLPIIGFWRKECKVIQDIKMQAFYLLITGLFTDVHVSSVFLEGGKLPITEMERLGLCYDQTFGYI